MTAEPSRLVPAAVLDYVRAVEVAQRATSTATDLEHQLRLAIAQDDGTPDALKTICALTDQVHRARLQEEGAHVAEEEAYDTSRDLEPDATFDLWLDLHPLPTATAA